MNFHLSCVKVLEGSWVGRVRTSKRYSPTDTYELGPTRKIICKDLLVLSFTICYMNVDGGLANIGNP